jgi:tetratricopeptide (TPR) repeat protein
MKCDRCGLESGLAEAFKRRRPLLIGVERVTCPNCERERQLRGAVFTYLLLPATAAVAYAIHPSLRSTRWLVGAAFVLLGGIPLAFLHELAHVITASLLGGRVLSVTIGFGRSLTHWRLMGVLWEIRLLPVGGVTRIALPGERLIRLKAWLVYASGPGLHFLLALAAWTGLTIGSPGSTASGSLRFWFYVAMFANLLLLLANLLPIQVVTPFGITGSDGWQLLRLPFLSNDEIGELVNRGYVGAAVIATRRKRFKEAHDLLKSAREVGAHDPEVANAVGYLALATGDLLAARKGFAEAWDHLDEAIPGQRYMLLNNLAYVDALLEEPNLLQEADEYSREAYENAPWIPNFSGTRGTVLAARGDYPQGIELLKTAMHGADGPDTKAENACLLALAEARRADLKRAESYMSLARHLDSECYLIPIVAERISRLDVESVPDLAGPVEAASPVEMPSRSQLAAWWQAPETWAGISAVWGFWNLLANQTYTIPAGLGFLLMAAVLALVPHSDMILGLTLVAFWTGMINLVSPDGIGIAYGGLHVLLAIPVFLAYRQHFRRQANIQHPQESGEQGVGLDAVGAGLPILSALAGLTALLIFCGMVLALALAAINYTSSQPGGGIDGFYQQHGRLLLLMYLVEPLALVAMVTSCLAIYFKARRRWVSLIGMVLATPILLVRIGLAVLDRIF